MLSRMCRDTLRRGRLAHFNKMVPQRNFSEETALAQASQDHKRRASQTLSWKQIEEVYVA